MIEGLPRIGRGQRVGLLGGSFDPPHAGHANITREALKRFQLDQVWWLVSPGNPLKKDGPAPMARRISAARDLMQHPRVRISDFEAKAGTRYTARTLRALKMHYPLVRFVWLMGADNLASFHHWQDWQWIMENVPIGVLARLSPAANKYARFRLRGREAPLLARHEAPAWCFINLPLSDVSSTDIRVAGGWAR